jgi:oligopeptide/dipeptide ABC transporter ATP-binding protein
MDLSGKALATVEVPVDTASQPLLQVRDLAVGVSVDATHEIRPLRGVSFQVQRGEVVGLSGESGAGKTTLALALMRLLPSCFQVIQGSIEFVGRPLLSLGERELRTIRGARISLIYQDSAVLNPVLRVGDHLVEVLRAHYSWPQCRYRERAMTLLEDMELLDVDRIYAAYPHQLSGGQRQRIVIAQALACQPELVIADEPTASLDPNSATEIVELLRRLKRRSQTAFLLISHDFSPLASLADRIMVMYAGKIVEQGPRDEILQHPRHPYTRALLACALPPNSVSDPGIGKRPIPTIAGSPPDLLRTAPGCAFENRCVDRMDICRTRVPEEIEESPTHTVRCFKYGGSSIADFAHVANPVADRRTD